MDALPPEVHGSVLGTPIPTHSPLTSRNLGQASDCTPVPSCMSLYVQLEAMGTFLTSGPWVLSSAQRGYALDLFWHEDCLKCGCCDCRLGEVGSTLYTKANLILCKRDYLRYTLYIEMNLILCKRDYLRYTLYIEMKLILCKRDYLRYTLYIKMNLILCKRDYLRLFGTTGYCAACNKVIPAFEMVMRAKSNVYHLECFACQQCNHRFCVGDRFYLCDNKILCEYDYEERLVFANMAYNPTSLAHIRRQVSTLQPAGDHINSSYECVLFPRAPPTAGKTLVSAPQCYKTHTKDDGSSGYGSPDSETFDTQCNQQV
uniref:LIM zinc-binding domain-containing protein n=1 Tax=Timema cristinae TaxID=61476 RepID=A0A7R9H6K9_TIMCR|nr:unnamed protein product [Timema cristinae]